MLRYGPMLTYPFCFEVYFIILKTYFENFFFKYTTIFFSIVAECLANTDCPSDGTTPSCRVSDSTCVGK